jgi:pyruvate/2-oxoglutarate/acetoin dehydrogenase E1 component
VLEPDAEPIELGRARMHREGSDVTIVTYGMMVHESQKAAEQLKDEAGIDVEILDLRTLLPLDEDAIIKSVKKTNRALIVHEDTRTGGIAGEIAMRISEKAFEWLDAPILRVTAIDTPVPYSPPLEDYYLPQVADIVTAVKYMVKY